MNSFWNGWIIGLTLLTVAGICWLLLANRRSDNKAKRGGNAERTATSATEKTTGHNYDGIEEYDNPLPLWWFNLFIGSIIFSVGYLIAYPGFGSYAGILGWTSDNQWQAESAVVDAQFAEQYGRFAQLDLTVLAADPQAKKMGKRLFANNCAACHGADASGNIGFPNLRDKDWLYGGSPDQIAMSIAQGRQAAMPVWGAVLNEQQIKDVTAHVLNISGTGVASAAGATVYNSYCIGCHGVTAEGNTLLGAPKLTDAVWLYGNSVENISKSIREGRTGKMPAHAEVISAEKIKLLTAYVYGLSM